MGKLLKKGEPDIPTVAKMVINDWLRGKLPYFVKPPSTEETEQKPGSSKEETTETVQPSIVQDLTKLETTDVYEGEDVRELENQSGDLYVSDGEEENEEDEDEEGEQVAPGDETGDTTIIDSTVVSKADDSDDEISSIEDAVNEQHDIDDAVSEIASVKSFKAPVVNRDEERANKKRKIAKLMKEAGSGEAGPSKMTSKLKRRLERENRQKKAGSNFYDIVDVKNRNRNKMKSMIDLKNANRGHCKKTKAKTMT